MDAILCHHRPYSDFTNCCNNALASISVVVEPCYKIGEFKGFSSASPLPCPEVPLPTMGGVLLWNPIFHFSICLENSCSISSPAVQGQTFPSHWTPKETESHLDKESACGDKTGTPVLSCDLRRSPFPSPSCAGSFTLKSCPYHRSRLPSLWTHWQYLEQPVVPPPLHIFIRLFRHVSLLVSLHCPVLVSPHSLASQRWSPGLNPGHLLLCPHSPCTGELITSSP